MFSQCCCGVFNLRQGVFVFGLLSCISGVAELMSFRMVGFMEIAVGSLGCYSAYENKDKSLAKYNLAAVVAAFVIRVSRGNL